MQGLIDEEKMDSFNIPQYAPSPTEVKCEVEKEGSFTINRLEVSEVNWNAYRGEFCHQMLIKIVDTMWPS